jgi:hypothetical protein
MGGEDDFAEEALEDDQWGDEEEQGDDAEADEYTGEYRCLITHL